jgi:Mg2+ and Co2+ transporter CorA
MKVSLEKKKNNYKIKIEVYHSSYNLLRKIYKVRSKNMKMKDKHSKINYMINRMKYNN